MTTMPAPHRAGFFVNTFSALQFATAKLGDTIPKSRTPVTSPAYRIEGAPMNRSQQGFTLIELLTVVAVIGILAAITLPIFQGYVARTQATTGLADIRGGVTAFEDGIQSGRTGSPDPAALGLAASTQRCSTIAASGAWSDASGQRIACTLRGHPQVAGRFVRFTRHSTGQWVCESSVTAPLLPVGCTLGS